MSPLFSSPTFAGFGPNRLYPWPQPAPIHSVEGRRIGQLRGRVRETCPRHPGVYGMFSATGELLYVGKAKSLRARLLSYFRPKGRDERTARILGQARAIAWEFAPSEFAALLRELELIRRWRPRCNVQGQPQRRHRTFVCLGRRPAPYAFLSRRPPAGAIACFGPVFAGDRAREAVRRVNDWFALRDCPQAQEMVFADQAELFPVQRTPGCLRHEIGTCLGPCAALCSRRGYQEKVSAVRAFLDGTDLAPLTTLQAEMTTASETMNFERAAVLRDKLTALEWLHGHLERLRQARARHTFVYPIAGHGGKDLWYLVRQGWVAASVPVPRDEGGRNTASAALETVFGANAAWFGATRAEEIDGVLLVSAWFRRQASEGAKTMTVAEARVRCAASGVTEGAAGF